MQQILSINCGSSSLKVSLFQLIGCDSLKRLLDVHVKLIGSLTPLLEIKSEDKVSSTPLPANTNIKTALTQVFDSLINSHHLSLPDLKAVAHRYVHGGDQYSSSVLITPDVAADLKHLADLAPLHNPACMQGIESALDYLPLSIPQIAVFDTAFHHSIPLYAANYAIPHNLTKKYKIKRYGFHGIAHSFSWKNYAKITGKKSAKIVTIHLGSGCSIDAIKDGISIDTSMGFTPNEGLIMATRAGNIDIGLVEFLCRSENKSIQEMLQILNFESGLKGISEISSDMQQLLSLNTPAAQLAVEMFCYRIVKYIGAYIAVLGGVDALIFTGGIGENSARIREKIIVHFNWLAISLEKEKNAAAVGLSPGEYRKIQSASSNVEIYVLAVDENLMLAEEALGESSSSK